MSILDHSESYHGMILQLYLGNTQHRVKILSRSQDGLHMGRIKTVKGNTPENTIAKAKQWIDENGKPYYGYRER